jgi:hypothetical protein
VVFVSAGVNIPNMAGDIHGSHREFGSPKDSSAADINLPEMLAPDPIVTLDRQQCGIDFADRGTCY